MVLKWFTHCLMSAVWFRCTGCTSHCVSLAVLMAAPGEVSQLKMEMPANYSEVKITWLPPVGHWEHYRVTLLNGSETLFNTTINKAGTEFTFSGLNLHPGRVYKAAVSVESRGLRSTVYCSAEIGTSCCLIKAIKPCNLIYHQGLGARSKNKKLVFHHLEKN